jgi:hypothetical protein
MQGVKGNLFLDCNVDCIERIEIDFEFTSTYVTNGHCDWNVDRTLRARRKPQVHVPYTAKPTHTTGMPTSFVLDGDMADQRGVVREPFATLVSRRRIYSF